MGKKHVRGSVWALGLVLALTAAVPVAAQRPCPPGPGGASVQVRFVGMKDRGGLIRVQLYGDDPNTFLDKGSRLVRLEEPAPAAGIVELCVPLPKPGAYSLFAFHDRNGNHKKDFSVDGFGFSRNPKLRLAQPDLAETLMRFGPGTTSIDIVMNYRTGLMSVGPVESR